MAKFGIKTSSSQEKGDKASSEEGKTSWFKKNQRSILAVALIALTAFVLRFVFAYSISAGSGFALSGGTGASEHLHNITQILAGTTPFGVDSSMFYPFGSVNSNPIFMDLFLSVFAMIGKACGMTAVEAASAVLAWSAVIFGVLSCIMAYFVGKALFKSKKGGYLTALFIAFCPIVITQTVFSNGTEVSIIEFLFLVTLFFLIRGIRALDLQTAAEKVKDIFAINKKAFINAAFAGIIIGVIALSWNGFRSVITVLIFMMAIQALIDRFRGKDVRTMVLFYSTAIIVPIVISAIYYIPAGLWSTVFSGVFLASIIAVAVCMIFAFTQKTPWTLTIPALAIGLIVLFVALFFAVPDYFNVIVNGNSTYAASIASLLGPGGLSLSKMATGFGPAVMWFGIAMILAMIWMLPKKISSPIFIFTLVFMCLGTYYGFRDEYLATVFSPVFAFGFAAVIMWIFDHVDFKTYFTSFRGSDFKTIWRKIIKPIPFVTILAIVFVICAPNAMYAIDAGISSNDNSTEGLSTGALNYYIKTNDDWKLNDVMSTYDGTYKNGAMVTWIDYADDVSSFGGFSLIADSKGNGAEAMANILLSDGTDGSSVAAMLIYFIKYCGIDSSKALLVPVYMTEAQFDELKNILEKPSDYKMKVIEDTATYGIFDSSVSAENIAYVYGVHYLTENFSGVTISQMYETLASSVSKNISYFLVGSGMFPVYYGYSSTFASLAALNGYKIADAYGTVSQFEVADYFAMYYTGVYSYTAAMYNTLLWRSFVGMSPEEAGFSGSLGSYNYLTALMLSDGTVKATPGYGLSNFEVDYDHWYVDYNASSEAKLDSAGWTKMLYKDAIDAQKVSGGLINYIAGYPVIMKYVSCQSGNTVSGTVVDGDGNGVKGIRVTVIDNENVKRSTAITNDEGTFTVFTNASSAKIEVAAGSQTMNDGSIIKVVPVSEAASLANVTIPATSVSGKFVDSDGAQATSGSVKMVITGQTSGKVYTLTTDDVTQIDKTTMKFQKDGIIPDIYSVSVTSMDGTIKYVEDETKFTAAIGTNAGLEIKFQEYTVTITANNDASGKIDDGVEIVMSSLDGDLTFSGIVENGSAKVTLYEGTYVYSINGDYFTNADSLNITSSTSKTIKMVPSKSVTISGVPEGQMAVIYADGFQKSVVVSADPVKIPAGNAGEIQYSVYSAVRDGGSWKVYWGLISGTTASLSPVDAVEVSGVLKTSAGTSTTGMIKFIDTTDGKEYKVTAGKDGKYTAILPKNTTFLAYATGNSQCFIGNIEVAAEDIAEKIITMEEASNITGKVYWGSSSTYAIAYAPVKITNISGKDGVSLNLLTDMSGAYSVYLPKDASCTITVKLKDAGPLYFGSEDAKVYEKTEEGVSSVKNFQATAQKVTVENASTIYKIKVDYSADKIDPSSTGTNKVTSTTWHVDVDETIGDLYYFYSGSVSVMPSLATKVIDVKAIEYYKIEVKGFAESDTVDIKFLKNVTGFEADDDHSNKKTITTTGADRSWYLEKNGVFEITINNVDKSQVMYRTVEMTQNYVEGDAITSAIKPVFKVSGFVGASLDGTLTVAYDSKTFDFDIKSGRYDISLPYDSGYTYELSALVFEMNDDDVYVEKYQTDAPIVITGDKVEGGKTYVYNMAATGEKLEVADEVEATISEVTMGDVSHPDTLMDVSFKFTMECDSMGFETKTYYLSAGSAWNTLVFYSDSGFTEQITSYTMTSPTSGDIYAKGSVLVSKAATENDDFSVVIKNLNDEEAGRAVFKDTTTGWAKTTPTVDKTIVDYGIDAIVDSEYKYAVKITNDDNFSKMFSVSLNEDLSEKWFVTYVYGDYIKSTAMHVEVKGYTTETVYVKITAKNSISDITLPESVEILVVSEDPSITMKSAQEGITISADGLTAKVTSLPMGTAISISDSSADGRGVINEKSGTPTYVWVMVALIIILVILLIWLSIRRGVFARKK